MKKITCNFARLSYLYSILHISSLQQCGFTNIHVNSDDGSHQVFTVKSVEAASFCDGCSPNGDSVRQLHSTTTHIESNIESTYSSKYVFADILNECGKCIFLVCCQF